MHLSLPVDSVHCFWYSPCIVKGDCQVIKSLLITRVCFYAEISIGSGCRAPRINKDVPSRITKRLGSSRAPELIRNDFSFSFYFQYVFNCFSIFNGGSASLCFLLLFFLILHGCSDTSVERFVETELLISSISQSHPQAASQFSPRDLGESLRSRRNFGTRGGHPVSQSPLNSKTQASNCGRVSSCRWHAFD